MRLFDIEYSIGGHVKKEVINATSSTRAIRIIQANMTREETNAFRIIKITLLSR